MAQSPPLTVKVRDLTPSEIPLSDLAEFLVAVENAVIGAAVASLPAQEANVLAPELRVSLVRITSQSTGLQLATSTPTVVSPAFRSVAKAIKESAVLDLPRRSREGVKKLHDLSVAWGRVLEFRVATSRRALALLTPQTELYTGTPPTVEGLTELYGLLERVGGAEPKVSLRVSKDDVVRFNVTEEMARELAKHLYTWIGLAGMATWSRVDDSIESFRLEKVLPYQDTPITKALSDLGVSVGEHWKDVEDVVAEVARVRYGDEDE